VESLWHRSSIVLFDRKSKIASARLVHQDAPSSSWNGCDDHHLSLSCSRGTVKPLTHFPGSKEPLAPANRSKRCVGTLNRCERLIGASKQPAPRTQTGARASFSCSRQASRQASNRSKSCSRCHCKASKRLETVTGFRQVAVTIKRTPEFVWYNRSLFVPASKFTVGLI
jgi:hypothetical protein